jgi:hypothetical protein
MLICNKKEKAMFFVYCFIFRFFCWLCAKKNPLKSFSNFIIHVTLLLNNSYFEAWHKVCTIIWILLLFEKSLWLPNDLLLACNLILSQTPSIPYLIIKQLHSAFKKGEMNKISLDMIYFIEVTSFFRYR